MIEGNRSILAGGGKESADWCAAAMAGRSRQKRDRSECSRRARYLVLVSPDAPGSQNEISEGADGCLSSSFGMHRPGGGKGGRKRLRCMCPVEVLRETHDTDESKDAGEAGLDGYDEEKDRRTDARALTEIRN